jgi:hypothetical protein
MPCRLLCGQSAQLACKTDSLICLCAVFELINVLCPLLVAGLSACIVRAGGSDTRSALWLRRYRRALRYKVSWPVRTCHCPHPHVLTYSLRVSPYSQSQRWPNGDLLVLMACNIPQFPASWTGWTAAGRRAGECGCSTRDRAQTFFQTICRCVVLRASY